MKDLAFELQVPADPAFRPIAAEAAGKYGETLGLAADQTRALEASLQEAVDMAVDAGSDASVSLGVEREGDRLELTVSSGDSSSTITRQLTGP